MYSQILSEHQVHIFGGVLVLGGLFFGILLLVVFLDRRGVRTYVPGGAGSDRKAGANRQERRAGKKSARLKRSKGKR